MINKLLNWWENLDENYKKIVLTILFSVTVIILSYLIYTVFFKPAPKQNIFTETGDEISFGSLPKESGLKDIKDILKQNNIDKTKKENLLKLTQSKNKPDIIAKGGLTLTKPQIYTNTKDPEIGQEGSIKYYNKSDGKFYKLNKDGSIVPLSDKKFPNVEKVNWSPNGNKAILEFPDGNNVFYDFDKEKQYSLPKEGQEFDFSSDGNKIAYEFITENPSENWLLISSPTGENTKAVEHIGKANPKDILIKWSPDNSKVAMFRQSAGIESEEIFFIGQNQENFKSLEVKGRGFEGIWSPKGDEILYNIYNQDTGYVPELWIVNSRDDDIGVNNKKLGIKTWSKKCIFSKDSTTVYCAVPLYLKQGSGIYPQIADNIPDTIYKINTKSGFKKQIAIPSSSLGIGLYTIKKLMLSDDETILYIVDKNGGIYKIQLK